MTDFKLEDRFSPTKLSYKNSESSLVGKNFTNIRRRAGHNVSVFLPGTKPIEINGSAHNDDHLSVWVIKSVQVNLSFFDNEGK